MASDVIFAGEEAGCEIFDEPRPKLEMEDVENFSYELSPLEMSKKIRVVLESNLANDTRKFEVVGEKAGIYRCHPFNNSNHAFADDIGLDHSSYGASGRDCEG